MTNLCPYWTIRNFLLFTTFVAICSLATAFIAQYIFHVEPCILCIYERYFYAAAGIGGLMSLKINDDSYLYYLFILTGLILIAGTFLGIYHLGVEEHWWKGTAACHGAPKAQTIEEFRQALMNRPSARCDQINWRIIGISATWWNLAWFAGFTGLWGATLLRSRCQRNTLPQ